MPDAKSSGSKKKSTQQLVQMSGVRDGVAIMQDGTLRGMIMVSSLNFALKSEDEQNAIVYAFQDFLNTLDFQTQITVMSRRLDITPYLEELKQRLQKQANDLLRLQMDEYINFVSELVKGNDIMTKTFFVTVPFSVQQSRRKGFLERLLKGVEGLANKQAALDEAEFDHYKAQLMQRVEQVAIGLRGVGLRVAPLQTQELLELFYTIFNPVTSQNQRLHNVAQLNIKEMEPQELVEEDSKKAPWARKAKK